MSIKSAAIKDSKRQYKALSLKQYKIMKKYEANIIAQRSLYGFNGFYKHAKRTISGAIDWSKINTWELNMFEECNKKIEDFNKLNDKEVLDTLDLFNKTQFSYSQSF